MRACLQFISLFGIFLFLLSDSSFARSCGNAFSDPTRERHRSYVNRLIEDTQPSALIEAVHNTHLDRNTDLTMLIADAARRSGDQFLLLEQNGKFFFYRNKHDSSPNPGPPEVFLDYYREQRNPFFVLMMSVGAAQLRKRLEDWDVRPRLRIRDCRTDVELVLPEGRSFKWWVDPKNEIFQLAEALPVRVDSKGYPVFDKAHLVERSLEQITPLEKAVPTSRNSRPREAILLAEREFHYERAPYRTRAVLNDGAFTIEIRDTKNRRETRIQSRVELHEFFEKEKRFFAILSVLKLLLDLHPSSEDRRRDRIDRIESAIFSEFHTGIAERHGYTGISRPARTRDTFANARFEKVRIPFSMEQLGWGIWNLDIEIRVEMRNWEYFVRLKHSPTAIVDREWGAHEL